MKKFKPGIEVFFDETHSGLTRVAAVTNFTGRTRNGTHLVELLAQHSAFNLVKIFSPEHGFTSDAPDGEPVADSHHQDFAVPVISLYGKNKKPSAEMLKGTYALIYDIQDVGVRFYTYISTLRNILEAADENGIPVWILDRPDVLGGIEVEGPMLQEGFSSFVGHLPIPVRYGLTPAELALWYKAKAGLEVEIKVWKCQNYRCSNQNPFPDFPWFKPSPSMPDTDTAQFYPGTCIFEGTQLSEGRGTDAPFRKIGAPWVNAEKWQKHLQQILPPQIKVNTCRFVPTFSKYEGESCNGISLTTEAPIVKSAVETGVAILFSLMQTHPGKVEFEGRPGLKHPFIDYLCGTDEVRKKLLLGQEPSRIMNEVKSETEKFARERKDFFLYPRN
jgi:uncharacterized protein YbbC (DUF1343 family)